MKICQKLRKLQCLSLKPEVAGKTVQDTCCYNVLLPVNPLTMVTNYMRQFRVFDITDDNTPIINYLEWSVNLICTRRIVKTNNGKKGSLVKT